MRAVDCFALCFDEKVLDMIVECTNRIGAQKCLKWAVLSAAKARRSHTGTECPYWAKRY